MSDFIPEGEPDFVVPPLHENHFQLNCYKVGELDVVVKVHDGVV